MNKIHIIIFSLVPSNSQQLNFLLIFLMKTLDYEYYKLAVSQRWCLCCYFHCWWTWCSQRYCGCLL
ncbi:hypothetical protein Hanom_Chr08g00685321 [Helianthus anomalus]